ncbi:hydrolase of the alpha/beta superfamily [Ilyonectria destructans]|nr:hydrolase of the alpha/beta superfamily [Ilyonectria destructans]
MSTLRKVSFLSRGLKVVGHLFTPSLSLSCPGRKKAAIIIGHQGTDIKEQTSGLYAETLASQGFVTLGFDAAYQGETEGIPRGLKDPPQRVEDFKCAVSFLSTLGDDLVDPSRISLVGICASAGYGDCVAATDPRIKAIAGVSPICFGILIRDGIRSPITGQIVFKKVNKRLWEAAQDRLDEAADKPPAIHNIADGFSHPREDFKIYYSDPRWNHPRCTNTMVTRSMALLVTPILLIAGNEVMTLPYSEKILERAMEPKELFVIAGKGHVDLYQDVTESGPKLVDFMGKALCV